MYVHKLQHKMVISHGHNWWHTNHLYIHLVKWAYVIHIFSSSYTVIYAKRSRITAEAPKRPIYLMEYMVNGCMECGAMIQLTGWSQKRWSNRVLIWFSCLMPMAYDICSYYQYFYILSCDCSLDSWTRSIYDSIGTSLNNCMKCGVFNNAYLDSNGY